MVSFAPDPTVDTPFLAMKEVRTDSQVSEESGLSQGSGRGSTPHNGNFQPLSEGASPTGLGETPGRPSYKCTASGCPVRCTQERVLKRHYQEKHQPRSKCLHLDCSYEWIPSRESEYRKHLTKKHMLEDDIIDRTLGRPRRRRRRVIKNYISPNFSPPPIERDRQSSAEPQQSPPLQDADITTNEHEDSSGLEHHANTHAPSGLLSEEDSALLRGHYKHHGRFYFPCTVHAQLGPVGP